MKSIHKHSAKLLWHVVLSSLAVDSMAGATREANTRKAVRMFSERPNTSVSTWNNYFLHLPLGNVTHGVGVGPAVNSESSNKFGEPVPGLLT